MQFALYVAKRLVALIPVLLVVSTVVFIITYLTPGDPASYILGENATPDQIERLREQMGLNEPLLVQYVNWLGGVITGDLGDSYVRRMPVAALIVDHFQPTASLALLGIIIALLIAIPAGVVAASKRGKPTDHVLMTSTLLGMSMPSFLLALLLVLVVGVQLRWLPVAGYRPLEDGLLLHLRYLVLPALCVGLVTAAFIARMTRSSMLEVLGSNYITTARSIGVSKRAVLAKYALRNAFLPVLTVIGQTFGGLISGTVVVETIFTIPGLGMLTMSAIASRDLPVIQGVVLVVAFAYVLVNLLVDLMYGFLDPRVRLAKEVG